MRRLYERGLTRQEIVRLFRFIDWMMALPEELTQQFEVEHARFEKERKMPYVTTIERIGRERGFQEGLQVGTEQGIQRGEALLLRHQLNRRFTQLPNWAEDRLWKASREEIERWSERLFEAKTVEEVFEM